MKEENLSLPTIKSKDELIAYIAQGNNVNYLFFWCHTAKDDSSVGKECLSQ